MSGIRWISPDAPPEAFPPVTEALEDPPGLLAGGGDLSVARLRAAYARGIFPWFLEGQPVLWWSPDPREVLFPGEFHLSRSMARSLRRGALRVTEDQAFEAVVEGCSAARGSDSGTWITSSMKQAYGALHAAGDAHSIEVWQGDQLVGGLYGVRCGRVFCGESMFSRVSNASKTAIAWLCSRAGGRGIEVIDCQMPSAHLRSLGSRPLPRAQFLAYLAG